MIRWWLGGNYWWSMGGGIRRKGVIMRKLREVRNDVMKGHYFLFSMDLSHNTVVVGR